MAKASHRRRDVWPLLALAFFQGQAGIGPFLSVYLMTNGWQPGLIGTVITLGGIVGTIVSAPAGALIDATSHKRLYVVASTVATLVASSLILISPQFWVVAASQVATAIAGAAMGPAVTGITLGIVHQRGFNRQNGRNQAFNHAGNLTSAALAGYLGWRFGLLAVFGLTMVYGLLAAASALLIPRRAIDDAAARGLRDGAGDPQGRVSRLEVLFERKALLVLAAALVCFHLGNGAMLPLYGLAVVSANEGDPASFTAMIVVIAQATMIVFSIVAIYLDERYGYWVVVLIAFLVLPVRGLIAANFISFWGVYPVQFLDGISAGLLSVAVPGIVARILNGTGRINLGQGTIMMVQGIGASLSPALGGWLAQELGYSAAFLILSAITCIAIAMWVAFHDVLRPAGRAVEVPEDAE